jgi:hypothetical protein
VTQDVASEGQSAALIEEACRRSGLLWVSLPGERARAVWHVWHDGAVHLVVGGIEQPLPGVEAATEAEVTVRSKDKWTRLVCWQAAVSRLAPGSAGWESAVPVLHAKRLNAPDGEEQPLRWARESLVVRLEPTGVVTESPGAMSDGSHAAPPPITPATTESPLPPRIGRRPRGR